MVLGLQSWHADPANHPYRVLVAPGESSSPLCTKQALNVTSSRQKLYWVSYTCLYLKIHHLLCGILRSHW